MRALVHPSTKTLGIGVDGPTPHGVSYDKEGNPVLTAAVRTLMKKYNAVFWTAPANSSQVAAPADNGPVAAIKRMMNAIHAGVRRAYDNPAPFFNPYTLKSGATTLSPEAIRGGAASPAAITRACNMG